MSDIGDPRQGTINGEVTWSGVGIHTGQSGRVTLRPAEIGRGRVFITSTGLEIPARLEYVVNCDRSTVLGRGEERVSTPEHLLSALAAAFIDNVEIHIEGGEVPILDGSALPFWQAIEEVGRRSQDADAVRIVVDQPWVVGDPEGPLVLILPSEQTVFEYVLHYPHPMLGAQTVSYRPSQGGFGQALAPARTFALWEEVQPLLERGMALGGSLENALVVYQDKYSTPLRVVDEPVCHKCLDLIGDFALLDARIQGRVLAIRAGHRWHVEAAQKLCKESGVQ